MSFFNTILQHIPFFKHPTVQNESANSTDTISRTVAESDNPTTSISRANTNHGNSLSTQRQTTTSRKISTINTQFIGNELYKKLQHFNTETELKTQDIQKLCGYADQFQDLKDLDLEFQKNIVLYILKDFNSLNSVYSKPDNPLTNNISKIFDALDLEGIKFENNDLTQLDFSNFNQIKILKLQNLTRILPESEATKSLHKELKSETQQRQIQLGKHRQLPEEIIDLFNDIKSGKEDQISEKFKILLNNITSVEKNKKNQLVEKFKKMDLSEVETDILDYFVDLFPKETKSLETILITNKIYLELSRRGLEETASNIVEYNYEYGLLASDTFIGLLDYYISSSSNTDITLKKLSPTCIEAIEKLQNQGLISEDTAKELLNKLEKNKELSTKLLLHSKAQTQNVAVKAPIAYHTLQPQSMQPRPPQLQPSNAKVPSRPAPQQRPQTNASKPVMPQNMHSQLPPRPAAPAPRPQQPQSNTNASKSVMTHRALPPKPQNRPVIQPGGPLPQLGNQISQQGLPNIQPQSVAGQPARPTRPTQRPIQTQLQGMSQ